MSFQTAWHHSKKSGVFISKLQWKLAPRSTENSISPPQLFRRHTTRAQYMVLQYVIVRDKEMSNENQFSPAQSCLRHHAKWHHLTKELYRGIKLSLQSLPKEEEMRCLSLWQIPGFWPRASVVHLVTSWNHGLWLEVPTLPRRKSKGENSQVMATFCSAVSTVGCLLLLKLSQFLEPSFILSGRRGICYSGCSACEASWHLNHPSFLWYSTQVYTVLTLEQELWFNNEESRTAQTLERTHTLTVKVSYTNSEGIIYMLGNARAAGGEAPGRETMGRQQERLPLHSFPTKAEELSSVLSASLGIRIRTEVQT